MPILKFEISDDAKKQLDEWLQKRPNKHPGALGGRYTYSLTPTNIGIIVTLKDELMKESVTIEDF